MSETKQANTPAQHNSDCVNLNTTEIDSNVVRGGEGTDAYTPSLGLDPLLIECPICLEQLVQPKSLPCLHTFCLKCISDCIIKDDNLTTFPCPICRKVTIPPDSSSEKAIWAFQFPTNNLIVEMIKYSQPTIARKMCEPCRRREDKESPAVQWCRICTVYLCQQCERDFHSFLHSTVETILLSELSQSPLKITTSSIKCSKHQKKMSLFCEDHQVLVCSLCVAISHRTCCNVLTPLDYAKTLSSDDVIRTRLIEGEHAMDALVTDFSMQLDLLERNKHEAEHMISDESKKLDDIVNRLRDQSMCELIRLYKAQKEHLETSIQRCKSLKNSMISTNKASTAVSCGTDSIQKISIYQRGKAEINSCAQVIRDLVRPFETKIINFEPECLSEKLETLATMGKMSMANQIRELPAAVDNWLPLSERVVKHCRTVTVKLEADKYVCSIRDVMWYDDLIILTDANNKSVKLFTENGEFIDVLNLVDRPWGVCKLPDNRVAVTRPDAKIISVIKLEETIAEQVYKSSSEVCQNTSDNSSDCQRREVVSSESDRSQKRKLAMSVEKDIAIDRNCYGICHVDDKFLVSNGKASPYQLYSAVSDGRTDLILEHESPCYYITQDITQKDVLVSLTSSIPGNAAVYRMSSVGQQDRTNISPAGCVSLNNAYGLDVDRDGNVYLCCGGLPGVVQVTADGATVRELVGGEQDVKDPRAVAVVNNKVIVADVAKTNANTIKIFHLR